MPYTLITMIIVLVRLCVDSETTPASSAKSMARRMAHIVTVAPPLAPLVHAPEVTVHRIVGVESLEENRRHRHEISEQKRGQHTSLTEASVGGEPIGTLAVVQVDTNSHANVELAENRHQLVRYVKSCSISHRTVRSTGSYTFCRSMNHEKSVVLLPRASTCSLRMTNTISMVDRAARKPHCSSASSPFCSQ